MSINPILNNSAGSTSLNNKSIHRQKHHRTQYIPQSKMMMQQPSHLLAQLKTGPGRRARPAGGISYKPVDHQTRKVVKKLYLAFLKPKFGTNHNNNISTMTYPLLTKLISHYGTKKVTMALIRALYDNKVYTRFCAIKVLGILNPPIKRAARHVVFAMMNDTDQFNREDAAQILGYMGPCILPWLLKAQALTSRNWKIRLNTIEVLSYKDIAIVAQPAIPNLEKLLRDTRPEIRRKAANALKEIRSESAAKHWWPKLAYGTTRQIRIEAASRLGMILPTGNVGFDTRVIRSLRNLIRLRIVRDASVKKAVKSTLKKIASNKAP